MSDHEPTEPDPDERESSDVDTTDRPPHKPDEEEQPLGDPIPGHLPLGGD
jgi:hypothetical protein